MDIEEKVGQDKIKIGVIGVFLVGLFVLAIGLGLTFFKHKSSGSDIQILSVQSSLPVGGLQASEIIVHVDGAVTTPGVYHLAANSRVEDVIKTAGGFSADADQAKINLAAKVGDGQKLHVLAVGESVSQSGGGSAGQIVGESVSQISINNASEAELDKLPGIGPVTAQKIITSRPYSSPEELLSKKVVSSSVYEKIKDLIAL